MNENPESGELELSPVGSEILDELESKDVVSSPVLDELTNKLGTDAQFTITPVIEEGQIAAMESLAVALEQLETEKTPDEIRNGLGISEMKRLKEQQDNESSDSVSRFFRLLFGNLVDLVLITKYAAIAGENTRIKPLNRFFRPAIMDVNTIISAFYRGEIDAVKMRRDLASQGYEDKDIDVMLETARPIPTAQDIVTFMVREVYTPDVVNRFKLMEGFDTLYPNAEEDAEHIGLTKENLAKYWAGHWRLPGITQAYEMFQRNKIDRSQLELILRASDIMPGFIDPLISISYNPITRVDIRRMHKLGILTREEVKRAYQDIGYSVENADRLTTFTERLNKEDEDGKALTRADILKVYEMEMISRPDASLWLQDIGYNKDTAEVYLDRVDLKKALEIIDLHIDTVKKQYTNNLIDRITASSQLDRLNLNANYRDALMERWTVDRDLKLKQPTKAEIMGWYKSKVITREQARTELSNLGYPDKYVLMYLSGVTVTEG